LRRFALRLCLGLKFRSRFTLRTGGATFKMVMVLRLALRTVATRVEILRLRTARTWRPHATAFKSPPIKTGLRSTEFTRPLLPLAGKALETLRARTKSGTVLHSWALRAEAAATLGEALPGLHPKPVMMMMMHPGALRTEAGTALRETLPRSHPESAMVMVVPFTTLRAEAATTLGEALPRLHPKSVVMMMVMHPRSLPVETRAALREALPRPSTKSSFMVVMHPRPLWPKPRPALREAVPRSSTESSFMVVMHSRSLWPKPRPALREALPRSSTESSFMVVMHSRSLWPKPWPALREALPRSSTESSFMVMHLRSLRPKPRPALREAPPRLPAESSFVMVLHSRSLRPSAGPALCETLSGSTPKATVVMMMLAALRARLRPTGLPGLPRLRRLILTSRLRPTRLAGLPSILRKAPLHLFPPALPHLLFPLLAPLHPFLPSTIATLGLRPPIASRHRRLRTASFKIRSAPISARLPRLPGLRMLARRTAHAAHLREKLVACNAAIVAAVELLQCLRRVLQFLRIDHSIVIRVQQVEQRRATAHAMSSIARPTSAGSVRPSLSIRTPLPIGAPLSIWTPCSVRTGLAVRAALPAIARQTLRRIWWLGRLRRWRRCRRRSIFLRTKRHSREHQGGGGREKRLEFHRALFLWGGARPAADGFMLKTPPPRFVV
jgi:hypothetical protein